jgi:hypothetical protein
MMRRDASAIAGHLRPRRTEIDLHSNINLPWSDNCNIEKRKTNTLQAEVSLASSATSGIAGSMSLSPSMCFPIPQHYISP